MVEAVLLVEVVAGVVVVDTVSQSVCMSLIGQGCLS